MMTIKEQAKSVIEKLLVNNYWSDILDMHTTWCDKNGCATVRPVDAILDTLDEAGYLNPPAETLTAEEVREIAAQELERHNYPIATQRIRPGDTSHVASLAVEALVGRIGGLTEEQRQKIERWEYTEKNALWQSNGSNSRKVRWILVLPFIPGSGRISSGIDVAIAKAKAKAKEPKPMTTEQAKACVDVGDVEGVKRWIEETQKG